MPDHLDPKLGQLSNGTVLRHKYKRGEYSGEVVTATVKDERIDVSGDSGHEDSDHTTRTPMGAARVTDRHLRGEDARNSPYSYDGWGWWEYKNEEGQWIPIRELPEWTRR